MNCNNKKWQTNTHTHIQRNVNSRGFVTDEIATIKKCDNKIKKVNTVTNTAWIGNYFK